MKAVPIVALVVLLFTDFRLNSAMGQVKGGLVPSFETTS